MISFQELLGTSFWGKNFYYNYTKNFNQQMNAQSIYKAFSEYCQKLLKSLAHHFASSVQQFIITFYFLAFVVNFSFLEAMLDVTLANKQENPLNFNLMVFVLYSVWLLPPFTQIVITCYFLGTIVMWPLLLTLFPLPTAHTYTHC